MSGVWIKDSESVGNHNCIVVVSVLPLGRFLASIFSTLSCFPPFSLVLHMTILSETRSAYPVVSFPSWSFSYHPTLYHLPQKAFASEYTTNPIFLPSPDHIHETSFVQLYTPNKFMNWSFLAFLAIGMQFSSKLNDKRNKFIIVSWRYKNGYRFHNWLPVFWVSFNIPSCTIALFMVSAMFKFRPCHRFSMFTVLLIDP